MTVSSAAQTALYGVLFSSLVACGAKTPFRSINTGSWPTYQANAAHNAVITAPGLKVTWAYDAGARINGGIAYANNVVYTGTLGGDLVALDAADGSAIWRSHVDNMLMSAPIVVGGRVLVGNGGNASMGGAKGGFAYAWRPDPISLSGSGTRSTGWTRARGSISAGGGLWDGA